PSGVGDRGTCRRASCAAGRSWVASMVSWSLFWALEGQLVDLGVVEAAALAASGRSSGGRCAGEGAVTRALALVEPEDGVGADVERQPLLAVVGLVPAGPEPA